MLKPSHLTEHDTFQLTRAPCFPSHLLYAPKIKCHNSQKGFRTSALCPHRFPWSSPASRVSLMLLSGFFDSVCASTGVSLCSWVRLDESAETVIVASVHECFRVFELGQVKQLWVIENTLGWGEWVGGQAACLIKQSWQIICLIHSRARKILFPKWRLIETAGVSIEWSKDHQL